MKILFIYWFFTYGGVEAVLHNRITALKRLYHDLTVGVLFLYNHTNTQINLGDKTYITNDSQKIMDIAKEYDLVSIIDTPPVLNFMDSIQKPLIIEVHTHYDSHRAYIKNDLPSNTKKVLTPSLYFKKLVETEIKNKSLTVDYVYNPLDYSFFETDMNHKNVTHINLQHFRPLLWIGRLDDHKNWERALSIFSHLIKKLSVKNLELFIIGKHGNYELVIETLKRFDIYKFVRYVPYINYNSLSSVFKNVALNGGIYVSTSEGESFGMTVAESMASGVPCVLNKLKVFEEITDNRAAFFKTEQEALDGIIKLIEDGEFRAKMVKNLRETAYRYHPDNIAQSLYEKFAQVLR